MCLICVELTKNTLTSKEARRNLGEMKNTLDKDHMVDVLKMIWKKEDEELENTIPSFEDDDWSWDGWGSD